MRLTLLYFLAAAALSACDHEDVDDEHAAASADAFSDASTAQEPVLTWDQLALGCAPMGEGAARHIMCNHGHALSLHNENLYERFLFLKDHGITAPNETELMGHGMTGTAMLPEPLTPILRARLGERVRIRLISYGGTQFHTFHVHGHLWPDDGTLKDTQTLGPAEVYDKAEFYAGGYSDKPDERAGVGDWMYHCHVEVHAMTGMWGLFRVLEKDGKEQLNAEGHFPHEVPLPLGDTGTTTDVYVVAAEVPLTIARVYAPATKQLDGLQRLARIYVPMADEKSFLAATAASVNKQMEPLAETWNPWILSLKLGAKVRVHLRNVMPDSPVTLHPHGVLYKNGEDGTAPEDVAKPMGPPVVMEWQADTAGTWPLHDHARSIENIGRGLFAAIVVKSSEEVQKLTRDYLIFFHDYDMDWMMGSDQPTGSGH